MALKIWRMLHSPSGNCILVSLDTQFLYVSLSNTVRYYQFKDKLHQVLAEIMNRYFVLIIGLEEKIQFVIESNEV